MGWLAFVVLSMAASGLGTMQPPNPALAGFSEGCEGKPQPCWYGIVPGVTTLEEANIFLTEQGYHSVRDYRSDKDTWNKVYIRLANNNCELDLSYSETETATTVNLTSCQNLHLGDVMNTLGNPYDISVLRGMTFQNDTVVVSMNYVDTDRDTCLDFGAFGRINSLTIGLPKTILATPEHHEIIAWHGFLSYTYYVNEYGLPSCEQYQHLP